MEQWSIFSIVVNAVQYDTNPSKFYNLDVKVIDEENHRKTYDRLKEEDRQVREINFGNTQDKLKFEVLAPLIMFDQNSDWSTTYLGRIDMNRLNRIKAKEKFPISEQGYPVGKLLDGMECQILLDMGASKSFMSKSHYVWCKSLLHYQNVHPKFREFK